MKECNGCVKTWLVYFICVNVYLNAYIYLCLCLCTEVEVVLDSGDIFVVEQCTNESTGDFLHRKGERETERKRVREARTTVGLSIS